METQLPDSICPVLMVCASSLSDVMPDDATRTAILGPLVHRIAGTPATAAIEQERAYIAADWACRVFAPIVLEATGHGTEAASLRALPRIADGASAREARRAAWRFLYAATAAGVAEATADAAGIAATIDRCATSAAAAAAASYATITAERIWPLAGRMLEAMIDLDHAAADYALGGAP